MNMHNHSPDVHENDFGIIQMKKAASPFASPLIAIAATNSGAAG